METTASSGGPSDKQEPREEMNDDNSRSNTMNANEEPPNKRSKLSTYCPLDQEVDPAFLIKENEGTYPSNVRYLNK